MMELELHDQGPKSQKRRSKQAVGCMSSYLAINTAAMQDLVSREQAW